MNDVPFDTKTMTQSRTLLHRTLLTIQGEERGAKVRYGQRGKKKERKRKKKKKREKKKSIVRNKEMIHPVPVG